MHCLRHQNYKNKNTEVKYIYGETEFKNSFLELEIFLKRYRIILPINKN